MNGQTQDCPICSAEVTHFERYPNRVCDECAEKVSDESGRKVVIEFNWSGGHTIIYADSRHRYLKQFIYIDGVKCKAEEDRFGRGIVIQTVEN
ncbi:MAG TPA: hypothetical protein PKY59_07380 [Pyrinomonadaceae bacterium]|nr:hypothetical protein [Pyrinomonadaceae bacterium]